MNPIKRISIFTVVVLCSVHGVLADGAEKGQRLLLGGDAVAAEAAFRVALNAEPESEEVQRGLVSALLEQNKLEQAKRQVVLLVRAAPESSENLALAGLVSLRLGANSTAERYFRVVLKRSPNDPQVLNYLAVVLHGQGKADEALTFLARAVKADPAFAEALYNLAAILVVERPEEVERARRYYRRAVELGAAREPSLESFLAPLDLP